ncbi:hypothetical protein V8F20_010993 [Naviculisporaceae sp. PSN 640]
MFCLAKLTAVRLSAAVAAKEDKLEHIPLAVWLATSRSPVGNAPQACFTLIWDDSSAVIYPTVCYFSKVSVEENLSKICDPRRCFDFRYLLEMVSVVEKDEAQSHFSYCLTPIFSPLIHQGRWDEGNKGFFLETDPSSDYRIESRLLS